MAALEDLLSKPFARMRHSARREKIFAMKRAGAATILVLFLTAQLFGWAPEGHAIIADIASSRLSPVARKNVRLLLGEGSMAAVSNWADDIRKDRPETFGWHFVDIPKDAPGFSKERDCYRPQDKGPAAQSDHDNCVVARIELFKKVLADENAPAKARAEALKFLVHFVGDIHQPLHGIDEARGGNDIKVVAFGSDQCGNYPCNLHAVWDYSLIEHAGYSEQEYVQRLNRLIRSRHLDRNAGGEPADWANESHAAARQILDQHVTSIDQAYWQANINLVDERLALAGLRLAGLLNKALGNVPTKRLKQELERHKNDI